VNQKQAKRARGIAQSEANRRGLWKKGESDVYAKWWRKLLAWFFLKFRKRYAGWVGRWYKSTLKRWSRLAYASVHDPDVREFERVRNKISRAEQRRRRKELETM